MAAALGAYPIEENTPSASDGSPEPQTPQTPPAERGGFTDAAVLGQVVRAHDADSPEMVMALGAGRNDPLQSLAGQFARMAREEGRSRLLRNLIEQARPEELVPVFEELYEEFPELVVDPIAYSIVPRLAEGCGEEYKTLLVNVVADRLQGIVYKVYGSRCLQIIIDIINTQEQMRVLATALASIAVSLLKDVNGGQVIQKCLQKFDEGRRQFIFDAIQTRVANVATHRHGCCVLQRSLDMGSDVQRVQLVAEVLVHAVDLMLDPYGNYVIQYILNLQLEFIALRVVQVMVGNLLRLSTNKFASNVVERALSITPPDVFKLLVKELVEDTVLPCLLCDQYGNYVVQTALQAADEESFGILSKGIKPFLSAIRCTSQGKKIELRLTRGYQPSGASTGGASLPRATLNPTATSFQPRRGNSIE
eukprot:Hpha_TRINITY_DN4035_c0_g1::TRINITY_DN4035_c0_g1_i1::g.63735::m.63735